MGAVRMRVQTADKNICADFSPDSVQTAFSLEEALLWIMDSYLS